MDAGCSQAGSTLLKIYIMMNDRAVIIGEYIFCVHMMCVRKNKRPPAVLIFLLTPLWYFLVVDFQVLPII
jgi:hypothetical protein